MSWMEFVLLCVVAGLVLKKTGAFLHRRTTPLSASLSEIKGPVGTVTAIAWCWLAPTTIMAVFVALSGDPISQWERIVDSVFNEKAPAPVAAINSDIAAANSAIATAEVDHGPGAELVGNRPQWTREENKVTGDDHRIVLKSRLWSTEEEAEAELKARAAALVRSDFELRHHSLLDPEGVHFLSDDRVAEVAVKERYVERFDQDFGKFTSPMNRVWWQVELSPVVRTEIYPAWKAAVVENRIIALGTILAMATLVANGCAMFARLSRRPNGNTPRAAVVTSTSLAAWVAADLFVASRLLS